MESCLSASCAGNPIFPLRAQLLGRSAGGSVGEWAFLGVLGGLIFWLCHRNYPIGTEAILPSGWRNGAR
jgi:hypothetical protein